MDKWDDAQVMRHIVAKEDKQIDGANLLAMRSLAIQAKDSALTTLGNMDALVQHYVALQTENIKLRAGREYMVNSLRDIFPSAHRLALELECLLLSCTDTCATAKWWESAKEALEQWRDFCREDAETHNAKVTGSPVSSASPRGLTG